MNTDSVLSTLLRYVNGQYKKDTNYDIALALLTHYSVIPEKTINELSELCFVSPASISRFVKLIGFHSFQEFKNACLNTLDISKTDYSPQIIKADKKDVKEIFQNYTKHVIDNIQFTYDHLDFEQLDHVCKYIHDSLEVLVLGLEFSTLLAQHIQNRFALMNKYITVAISNDEQLEAAHNLKENSVVIILSVEGGYFYRHSEVHSSTLYSNISPGWQSSSLQIASRVEKRMALAFPVFKIERFAGVRSILSASSPSEIFRFAIITSRFTIIGINYSV